MLFSFDLLVTRFSCPANTDSALSKVEERDTCTDVVDTHTQTLDKVEAGAG